MISGMNLSLQELVEALRQALIVLIVINLVMRPKDFGKWIVYNALGIILAFFVHEFSDDRHGLFAKFSIMVLLGVMIYIKKEGVATESFGRGAWRIRMERGLKK